MTPMVHAVIVRPFKTIAKITELFPKEIKNAKLKSVWTEKFNEMIPCFWKEVDVGDGEKFIMINASRLLGVIYILRNHLHGGLTMLTVDSLVLCHFYTKSSTSIGPCETFFDHVIIDRLITDHTYIHGFRNEHVILRMLLFISGHF
jgi:hypothetical protein